MCVFKLVQTKVVASIFEWNLLRDIFDHLSHEIMMVHVFERKNIGNDAAFSRSNFKFELDFVRNLEWNRIFVRG